MLCPHAFRNFYIKSLQIDGMVDHFIKRNLLRFYETEYDVNLNSTINTLTLSEVYNLNFNSNFLNPPSFLNLNDFSVNTGAIKSIQVDLFAKLASLRYLQIGSSNFASFFHNLGFEWMQSINPGLKEKINISEYLNSLNSTHLTPSALYSTVIVM
jgi:hypothetical protein